MADNSSALPGNVLGPWYVDANCIGCGLCTATAPEIFSLTDDGQAVVIRQPGSKEEANLALQALNECPVQAIGSDRTGS